MNLKKSKWWNVIKEAGSISSGSSEGQGSDATDDLFNVSYGKKKKKELSKVAALAPLIPVALGIEPENEKNDKKGKK
jgi:hypothetical protein